MGEGGLEHTLRKFGSDQFEEHIKDKYKAKHHSIAWWYMGSLIGSVAGMLLVTFLLQRSGLGKISFMLMLVAFLVLVLGTLFYYRDVPVGSPFTYMFHVVVAMVKKRHLDLPVDDTLIHGGIANMSDDGGMEKHDQSGNPEENCGVEKDEEIKGGLIDDEQLRTCFDKTEAKEESKWRVCTQTEIEETKLFLRLFPIWATFIMYGMVLSMGKTFFIEQASTLDANFSPRFRIPVTFLLAVGGFSKLVITKACLPLLNKLTRLDHGIPPKVRIGAGLFLSVLCCLTASSIENRRLKVMVQKKLRMTIFWLIPQFLLLGGMEGLVGDGIDDLFISQVPETIWKCGPAFSESVEGMGSILSAIAMVLTDQMSKVGGRHGWFAKEIDVSRLDRYYFMFAVLSLINLCWYALVAKAYIGQGTENQNKRENNRGTVKRSVACAEMIAVIISGRN
ncbi:protein NRT1/ PTR FAMILY 5.7-like [Magnolia sinica]|uniref:protein NRT1/ PTR FAMILY 5.7-like n=1 Tax=Magnolia sinica TaxID=86752 RepID=UPI0026581928|nr:protein NRT1/ PTR FAMILY 5.7-like [Magnolia sinica]